MKDWEKMYAMLIKHRTELWRAVSEGSANEKLVLRQSAEWMALLDKLEVEK
jgi:hypothetical protein